MGKSLHGQWRVSSVDWSATFEQLLGKVSNKFRGSWIEMGWLEKNFKRTDVSTSDVEKEQFVCAFIMRLIVGLLMPNKSQNLVHLKWLLLLVDLKEVGHVSQGSVMLAILFHKKYIEMWQRRYDYLPMCEPFLTPELVTSADCMDWLRHNDKLYLLLDAERSRQRHLRRST
ncbi:hypothetical protein Gotri_024225 [Gossypium trilobum]|uniref:Uncharacterized protein n=1 Tax=Gossypium trilobum TaxID=34281 RepID=A0A7J9DLK5_9ROSI|nr:hypothetical protein [Gossypium trilobum]